MTTQHGVIGRHFVVLATELARQHSYKWPKMELLKPDCSSHDNRLETHATWEHLASRQMR